MVLIMHVVVRMDLRKILFVFSLITYCWSDAQLLPHRAHQFVQMSSPMLKDFVVCHHLHPNVSDRDHYISTIPQHELTEVAISDDTDRKPFDFHVKVLFNCGGYATTDISTITNKNNRRWGDKCKDNTLASFQQTMRVNLKSASSTELTDDDDDDTDDDGDGDCNGGGGVINNFRLLLSYVYPTTRVLLSII
jgi:hypothetical protein